jgi:hypothetical protein
MSKQQKRSGVEPSDYEIYCRCGRRFYSVIAWRLHSIARSEARDLAHQLDTSGGDGPRVNLRTGEVL